MLDRIILKLYIIINIESKILHNYQFTSNRFGNVIYFNFFTLFYANLYYIKEKLYVIYD